MKRVVSTSYFPAKFWLVTLLSILTVALTSPAVRAGNVTMNDISIDSLGHEHFFNGIGNNYVTREGIGAFGGSYSGANTTTSFVNGDTVIQHIVAPAGKMFSVTRDPAYSSQAISFNFQWLAAGDGVSVFNGTLGFDNLVGAAPAATTSVLGVGNAGNAIVMQYAASISTSMTFTGITISIPVATFPTSNPRTFTLGTSSSVPFQFFGSSPNDVDVPMASLVDVPEPATMGLLLPLVAMVRRRRR